MTKSTWVILTSVGTYPDIFETEEACEARCKELRAINQHVNIFYLPHELKEPPQNKTTFPCHFERDEKGIYMEVDTKQYENLVGFTFYNRFDVAGEVCLDETQIRTLIELLQESLKK